MDITHHLTRVFRGRGDCIAIQHPNGTFRPSPVEGIYPKDLDDHILQRSGRGFYVLDTDSKCCCSCADFDGRTDSDWKEKSETLHLELVKRGFEPLYEISQSGQGAHVWLIFDEPVSGVDVRCLWLALTKHIGVEVKEIFPRQGALPPGGMGNLIRYPLWNKSHFYDPETEQVLDAIETLPNLKMMAWIEIEDLLAGLKINLREWTTKVLPPSTGTTLPPATGISGRVERLVGRTNSLLGRRWLGDARGMTDTSPSGVAMSLACEMVRLHVPAGEIEDALRYWCRTYDPDKVERAKWVADTVLKAHDFVSSRTDGDLVVPITTLKDAALAYIRRIERGPIEYIKSGIDSIDRAVDGPEKGETVVLAARTNQGKTALALQWVESAAKQGHKSLILSMEMSNLMIGKRALMRHSRIDSEAWDQESPPFLREDLDRGFKGNAEIYIADEASRLDVLEKTIVEMAEVHGVEFVVVDYLQLVQGEDDSKSRYDIVTNATTRLTSRAKQLNLGMILLSQFNRGANKHENGIPQLDDLRESGQIENDADLIIFGHYPHRDGRSEFPP